MFFDLFALIARATEGSGLWHEDDGFFYDRLVRPDGTGWPIAVRSMSGLVPVFAAVSVRRDQLEHLPRLRARVDAFLENHGNAAEGADVDLFAEAPSSRGILALVDRERLRRIMRVVGGEGEMLSPHGVRAVSAAYRDHPFVLHAGVEDETEMDYEPAESTTDLFGGNSNWRGPVWLPVNYLLQQALRRYGEAAGTTVLLRVPAGSGRSATFTDLAADLADRLVGLYLPDADGRRAVWGGDRRFTHRPGLARRAPLLRVLQRRRRRRPRCEPPDGLDGPDREPAAGAHPRPLHRVTSPSRRSGVPARHAAISPSEAACRRISPEPRDEGEGSRIGAMTRTRYFTAMSLDGYLADADGSLEWLLGLPDSGTEGGFATFLDGIGAIAMGATTYEWVLAHEPLLEEPERWQQWYGPRPSWVFTHRDVPRIPGADIRFVADDVRPVHREMVQAAGERDIWLVGGGLLAGAFADAGLLDQLQLSVAPALLGGGAPLLPRRLEGRLRLTDARAAGVFAELRYEVDPPPA